MLPIPTTWNHSIYLLVQYVSIHVVVDPTTQRLLEYVLLKAAIGAIDKVCKTVEDPIIRLRVD